MRTKRKPKVVIIKKEEKVSEQALPRRAMQRRPRAGPLANPMIPSAPRMRNLVLRHSELVASLNAVSETGKVRYSTILNAGLATTFPWLSRVASCFDLYKFLALSFTYVPVCSQLASGQYVMAVDYDVTDVNDSVDISYYANMFGAKTNTVYRPCTIVVDVTRAHSSTDNKYVTLTQAEATSRFNSYGTFYFQSSPVTNATTIGSLWVNYSVLLIDPQTDVTVAPGPTINAAPLKSASTYKLEPVTTKTTSATTATFNPISLAQSAVAGTPLGGTNSIPVPAEVVQTLDYLMKYIQAPGFAFGTTGSLKASSIMPPGDISGNCTLAILFPERSSRTNAYQLTSRWPIMVDVVDGSITSAHVHYDCTDCETKSVSQTFESTTFPITEGDNKVIIFNNNVLIHITGPKPYCNIYFDLTLEDGSTIENVRAHDDVAVSNDPGFWYYTTIVTTADFRT